ncbi:MAG TPA: RIP metalloprotease RseP [bacterium]|nr:RIP metalloprotease RseP [bacterium]HOL67242.1 RIP metalloprotease RseP [bacterium]HPP11127.1 RIP metalloprotease RseP [bacterium]
MIVSVLGVLVLFSVVIVVHEFGHFWVAKKSGVRVERFSVGFGPKLVTWRGRVRQKLPLYPYPFGPETERVVEDETEYQICLFPFGGFIKMAGEEYQPEGPFQPDEYMAKPPGSRARIVAAGALHNLFFGLLVLIPVFMMGVPGYDGTRIGSFVKGLPAETSGLQIGDEVLSVNGKQCREWFDVIQNIRQATRENPGQPVHLVVRRHQQNLSFSIMARPATTVTPDGKETTAYLIGISPREKLERYPLFPAVIRAGREFGKMTYGVFLAFKLLFTRQVSAKLLSGPVGIAQWGAEIVHAGLARFLYFVAFISVNLGFINLFPFPILDGGHLVGLLLERLRRKRPSKKFLEVVQYAGAVALIFLALFVTYNDLLRLLEARLKSNR